MSSSSPPWSLPPAAAPVTTPPLPPSQSPALPLPRPQTAPFLSPPSPPTSLPALSPVHNSITPVSSPLSPPLPPLPAVVSPPPPSLSVISPPPPTVTSPPPTPLPSRPSPAPPPQPILSPPPLPLPLPLPRPKTPLPSPKTTKPQIPPAPKTLKDNSPPPTLSTPIPPATTSTPPPSASPSQTSPPPEFATVLPPAATTTTLPPTIDTSLSPSPDDAIITPLPTTALSPPPLTHSPSPSLLPAALEIQKPQPNAQAALLAGCVIGGVFIVFILLGIALICYKRRTRKNNVEDQPKPLSLIPKDNYYDSNHTVAQPGVHVIKVLSSNSVSPSSIRCTAASEVRYEHQPQWLGFPMDASGGTFTYDQLVVATNGFSEANLLGQGGFGYVHKGVFSCGKEVAVKQLKTGSRQGEREFQAEVDIISRVHHKHLVSLVGHCIKGAERLLVYEFVPNDTLEFHLHGIGQTVLEWDIRLKIATGSAKGLAYLHEDCNPKIIHRDIKASNILVDHRFEAKVSDFGLAKSFSGTNTHMTHLSTRVVGTFGYLAPEYASSGKVTEKSDVYSYGVVLLELITGRPPISTIDSFRNEGLVQWARPLLTQALEEGVFDALVDPRLETNYKENEMARMVACAAACVRHSAWLRPRMSQIVNALEGVASLMDLREGFTPGNSAVYNCSGNSYYNSRQYEEDLRNSTATMPSQEYGISRYTQTTSGYGLNPSGSSSETPHTM